MSRNHASSPGRIAAGRIPGLFLAAALVAAATACTPATPPPSSTGTSAPGTTAAAAPPSSSPQTSPPPQPPTPPAGGPQTAGKPGHVFVINLENKGYDKVWGTGSEAPYLSQTLRAQGVLLSEYYAIDHSSSPNYLAQISGQASNPMTRDDCRTYVPFTQTGTSAPGQAEGTGCVYPVSVPTVAGQLSSAGKSWKGYMEDMQTPCQHPKPGAKDDHQSARVGDQYATRHNPFVYFEAITSSPDCQNNVVNFTALTQDLKSADTTPNLSYISPNLCNDGHDSPCVDGNPGGLAASDSWLRQQVPAILDSPAFKKDGMLVITFDEADGQTTGSAGIPGGAAGGRVGALVLSPFTRAGTSSDTQYNHFSLLASIEDAFSLPRLGLAGAPGLQGFGADVFDAGS
ncbi:alkaline phosphatase family protein [Arthrobacter sp. 2YAF22_2]|uniref:alkaline phosphatase family protein n=1 Tax=Arthrobacter sp. 2YAF22_2 TaxID=3233029 RepID=UPI003F8FCEAC